jgi:hypothetical protein
VSRSARPRRAVLGAAVALILLSAACSKGDAVSAPGTSTSGTAAGTTSSSSTTTTTAAPTTTVAPVVPTWPLTGVPGDPAAMNIPVLAVKVDNSPQARPHAGLNHADQVYELNVEGITRFMELYHSSTPGRIGPVRSARSSDIDLFENLHRPLLAWSGGNPGVTAEVNDAQDKGYLVDVGHVGPTGVDYYRDNPRGRDFEHTLYVDAPKLRADFTPADAGPPAPMFTFRKEGAPLPPTAIDAPGMVIDFGLGVRIEYVWDAERHGWDRFQMDQMHGREDSAFLDEEGNQVAPENVVILKLQYEQDSVDARSPKAISVGEGEGIALTQGKAILVKWTRAEAADPWNLRDAFTGEQLDLTPGRTWVALPDANADQLLPLDAAGAAELLTYRR